MAKKNIKHGLIYIVLFFLTSCNNSGIITTSEKEWLKQHPNLIVGIQLNAPPYQFVNEKGEEVGIFIDFLKIIENKLNYKFKKTYQTDFPRLLIDTKEGNIDIILEIQATDERKEFLNFTPYLLSDNHVIVVRNSVNNIENIDDLKTKNIAVVNKYAIQEYLIKKYPDYKILPLTHDVVCLRAVSTGQADAFICQQAVATYYIEKEGISNLKIAGEINYTNELAIASRNNLDTLNTILTKAVNSIGKNEKQKIYKNYFSYTVKPFYLEADFLVTMSIVVLLTIFFAFLINLILQKRVNQKTLELIKIKEKAEESDRLKSAFLANMSHEIRTPMNGILGFSELLKNPDLSGDQQQEYIRIIQKSGTRMLNIINDIVDISKIEAGLMKVDVKESNVNEQMEYIYTFFKPEVEAKGLQLFLKNSLPAKEATIKTDREKLFAILTNLVKNAIKYTNEGSIKIGYVLKMGDEAVNQSRNAELEFFIKDTGIGIPKNRQKVIFERFIQAEIVDKMARQGAGLGLAITKAYIEMLGGRIWVDSEEGKGSTFYFTIPYNTLPKQEIATENIGTTGVEPLNLNLKILIVEDDKTSEMLLEIMIKKFGNEILKTKTGIEAIMACRNNPDIDLVLMDIQMPEMSGYEATRQIRKFNNDVVIIAQTAYGLSGDREKAFESGCNDYIAKPINSNLLKDMIQKHFNKWDGKG